jgi:uncharacterized protein (TIGR02118 family)
MSVTFMAMYPNTPNTEFDFEYYTKQHIPMAKKLWANKLLNVQVVKNARLSESHNKKSDYLVIATFEVTNMEDLHNLIKNHSEQLSNDFPNYTNVKPIIQISEVIV